MFRKTFPSRLQIGAVSTILFYMSTVYRIIALLGGLSMFLYGMRVMGDGLKSSSGSAMKNALEKVTNKPILGFLLGAVVTCAIQSSTAAIVLTVGLVGAGIISYRQSVGIVLGANVGTAVTSQIIRLMDLEAGENSLLYFFKADNLAPLALIIGIVCLMFLKGKNTSVTGSICCGFGVLFMGLISMSNAVTAFREPLGNLLTSFSENYFLGFLAGAGVTCVIQSSSAVVGILQSIASSMGIAFAAVFTVIIGVNIGDCITTFLVCRPGAKPAQIRTTLVHVIYNIFAALLIVICIVIGRLTGLLSDSIFHMTLSSGGIANVHGLFRLVPAVILLPFSGLFATLAEKIVPDRPLDSEDQQAEDLLKQLDPHLNLAPALALDRAEATVASMVGIARHNFEACRDQVFHYDPARRERIAVRESYLDRMTDATSQYLLSLSSNIRLKKDMNKQNFLLKAVVCFERIGDLAENISDNVEALRSADKTFSDQAMEELKVVFDAVDRNLELTEKAYSGKDHDAAWDVEPLEEVIDDLIEYLKSKHVERMTKGLCDADVGIPFQDMLSNLEHISDQCSDIAVYVLAKRHPEIAGKEHSYIYDLHASDNKRYQKKYREAREEYFGALARSESGSEN